MISSPISGIALKKFLTMGDTEIPPDCTPQVLDLCTRRRSGSLSPKPEGAHQPIKFKISPEIHSTVPEYTTIIPPYSYAVSDIQNTLNNNNNNNISSSFSDYSPGYNMSKSVLTDIDSSEEGSVKSDSASELNSYPLVPNVGSVNQKVKPTRPFKAYPKNPFLLALGTTTADVLLGQESTEAYAEFRQKMLSQVRSGHQEFGVTNAKMRRTSIPSPQELDGKDASYWEKRRKNNEAAKRSRDARRAKEDEIAIRAAFLEQENLKLKYEVATLRNEASKLRCMIYNN